MSQAKQPPAHQLTWLAIIACVVLVVPGFLLGGLVKAIYQFFLTGYLSMSWLPDVVTRIALQWFPGLLHGMIAGAFAMGVTAHFFRKSNMEIVSYAAIAVCIALVVLLWGWVSALQGFREDVVGAAAEVIGLSVGLHLARNGIK